jgi:spore coat polysaccharide biosynthesis protein SpsF
MVLALIQARLGSSRLPGKSALPLPLSATGPEHTILGHVVSRAQRAACVQKVMVATTTQPLDVPLANLATQLGLSVFRGDEQDVLGRFAGALSQAGDFDTVVRLTADNPAIDPAFIDAAVAHHLAAKADYTYTSGLPLGTNIEVISALALQKAHREATAPDEREHVTPYLRRHPELFRLETLALTVLPTVAGLRLTVDYPSDYALASLLFNELGAGFSLPDLAGLLSQHPWIAAINADNVQR